MANSLVLCAEAFGLDQPDSYNYLRRSSSNDDGTINDRGTFQDVLVRSPVFRVVRAAKSVLSTKPQLLLLLFFSELHENHAVHGGEHP